MKLEWPLGPEAVEELRWYLEDYLRAPFGVYQDRGARVAELLRPWGEEMFEALFGSGPARDAYVRLRSRRLADTELIIRSSSATVLARPWELLYEPGRTTPLAFDLTGLMRSLPTAELGEAPVASGERLRVLIVISRPGGAHDVGYQLIARPLVERLEELGADVDLVVLRPPTLDALRESLTDAVQQGRPYQIVHFDGHGALRPDDAEGMLVFEQPEGGGHLVTASRVAEVVAAGRVPVVVLNACESGAVGRDLEAGVAPRLLQAGVASVVAMAYRVYAVAAAEFMTTFYEQLFTGATVSEAVGAGRRRLYERPERPSPKGRLPLEDWIVPVHYLRRDVRFPGLRATLKRDPLLAERLDPLPERAARREDLKPVDPFIGRDSLFFELEAAVRQQRIVVLHGLAGTGKTELAKAFGRWWSDTGGVERPESVIFQSFEPGVASFGLDGVIAVIGLRLLDGDFARLGRDERRRAVEELLEAQRVLLIWDNFESVVAMPDKEATPPLDAARREEQRGFLARVAAGGKSAVIVTSLSEEEWLGERRAILVRGLTEDEAIVYADQLLSAYPRSAPRRATRMFAELLEWLDGHPLSMRLVLPHLESTEPTELLAALRGYGDLPVPASAGGRQRSLAASVRYSFEHLRPQAREVLVALCLLHGVAEAATLGVFSRVVGVPERFSDMTEESWAAALAQAADVGLLARRPHGVYAIHPALPVFLATWWRDTDPAAFERERDAAARSLLVAYGVLGERLTEQISTGDEEPALAVMTEQRRALGYFLGQALEAHEWRLAMAISQPLQHALEVSGYYREARAWVDRVRVATEDANGAPPDLDSDAGHLWIVSVAAEASRAIVQRRLEEAEQIYQVLLQLHEARPRSDESLRDLGVVYHQLSLVAEQRSRHNDAETWCRKALEVKRELGDERAVLSSYQQLAKIARRARHLDTAEEMANAAVAAASRLGDQMSEATACQLLGALALDRERFGDAFRWYSRSLAIVRALGDRSGIASNYHELGRVALQRNRADEAEMCFRKSLTICEELGDEAFTIFCCCNLGYVAQLQGRRDEAEKWSLRALDISERLRDRESEIAVCIQLGDIAHERGLLGDAEHWLLRAKKLAEELGARRDLAMCFGKLGWLAETRELYAGAIEWYLKVVLLIDRIDEPDPVFGTALTSLKALVPRVGISAIDDAYRALTGGALPSGLRGFLTRGEGQA